MWNRPGGRPGALSSTVERVAEPPATVREAIVAALLERNRGRAAEPLRLPTADGVFPSSLIVSPSPVVPDANVLRNDVLYACRRGRPTALVTAAKGGLLRLFAARHVVD